MPRVYRKPADLPVAIPVFQQPGSNALKLSRDVREAMETLKRNFPAGLDYAVVYDPTVFVDKSIDAVKGLVAACKAIDPSLA